MKNIYKIIIIIVISYFILYCGYKKDKDYNNSNIKIPMEISEFVTDVLQAIKNEDIKYIINVLYDGEVEYDYYKFKPKEEVINDLIAKKRIYAYLFNVKLKSIIESMQPGQIPEEMSVKELINKNKNIMIEKIEYIDEKRKILRCHLTNDFEINARKNKPYFNVFGLDKIDIIIIDNKCYLYSLIFDYMPSVY